MRHVESEGVIFQPHQKPLLFLAKQTPSCLRPPEAYLPAILESSRLELPAQRESGREAHGNPGVLFRSVWHLACGTSPQP